MYIVSVVTVTDGVLLWHFAFNTVEEAESMFVDLVINEEGEQPSSDELNGAIDDGVWDSGRNTFIYIAQSCSREDYPFNE